jgi:hydantoinase/carbamoylase family amidase
MRFLRINIERLRKNLLEVGSISNAGDKGYTRLAFSKEEKSALNWLEEKLNHIGLTVHHDNLNNIYGRLGDGNKPGIAFGSHLDTVPEGGLFDGALGVITALECMQTIKEQNMELEIPLELICFVGEEANLLGGTFGSRAIAGLIEPSKPLTDRLNQFDFTWEDVSISIKSKDEYLYFLELHIEQGKVLETNDKKIGIVSDIAGILRLSVTIHGKANHAGTTPMNFRDDALVKASQLVIEVNQLVENIDESLVATIGELNVHPNLANVVPGNVKLTIEIRGGDWDKVKQTEEEIRKWLKKWQNTEISVSVEKRPNQLSNVVQRSIEETCNHLNVAYQSMVSGANHDANSMTYLTQVGLIFVPSREGISHNPDEFTSWEDIEVGANVMLNTILRLKRDLQKKVI